MNCPSCSNISLEITERLGFHFKSCPSCNGMWFERAELNKVLDKLATDQPNKEMESSVPHPSTHAHRDSAITRQIYENREMHNEHEHPHKRHWIHRLFR
jgi:Zn-finger nucleic acid-binding protein